MVRDSYSGFPRSIADPVQYFAYAYGLDQTDPLPDDELSRVDQHKLAFTADNIDPELIQRAAFDGMLRFVDARFEQEFAA